MKSVKRLRRDSLRLAYEMQKASVFYAVFVISAGLWGVALIAVPVQKNLTALVYLLGIPVLWAEFAWLFKDSLVQDVLKARDRLKFDKYAVTNVG